MSDESIPDWRATRARIAATARHHPDEDVTRLRRTMASERTIERIQQIVDQAPPLSDAQRARLAAIFASVRPLPRGDGDAPAA
jgi:hypothetical protein